jgi:hypothetical protein
MKGFDMEGCGGIAWGSSSGHDEGHKLKVERYRETRNFNLLKSSNINLTSREDATDHVVGSPGHLRVQYVFLLVSACHVTS